MNGNDIISKLDYYVAKIFNGLQHSEGEFFNIFFKLITKLGDGGLIFLIISVILISFKKTRKIGLISLVSILFGSIITNIILKNIIARPRPFINQDTDFYQWWIDASSLNEKGFSFPSGHTTAAACFGFTLFICLNKKYSFVFCLIPIVMGISRIYFMVHYFSDVMGAMIVGAFSVWLGMVFFKYCLRFYFFQKILYGEDG